MILDKADKLFNYKGGKITWLGHYGFRVEDGSESLCHYVLLSHEHFDHCSPDDLKKVLKIDTIVVATPSSSSELAKVSLKEVRSIKPGDKIRLGGFEVKAVPAYNTNKYMKPGKHFHPKEDGMVGYVVKTRSGVTIYHTGDSDVIPEMRNLSPDIALVPVSGTYVMTADEAKDAVSKIKPKIAIPMHYGTIVGSIADAEKFKKLAKCEVQILIKE